MSPKFKPYIRWYAMFSGILTTLLGIFITLNCLAWILLQFRTDASPDKTLLKRNSTQLEVLYPGKNQADVAKILAESWTRRFSYEPFTGFKEASFSGQYVNVSDVGFRQTKDQGPWPPKPEHLTIFLFGGSTTFNYGLPDTETIASYLQGELQTADSQKNAYVYNFGRGYYYSTQELILFERLLLDGYVPDVAIFMDGLNDFVYTDDEPAYTQVLENFFSGEFTSTTSLVSSLLMNLPLGILMQREVLPLFREPAEVSEESTYNDPEVIEKVVRRFRQNIQMIETIAREFKVQPVFVLQPIPVYKPSPNAKQPDVATLKSVYYAKFGYERLAKEYTLGKLGSNLLWLADIQEQVTTSPYVDGIHYSASLSKELAKHLANYLKTHAYRN